MATIDRSCEKCKMKLSLGGSRGSRIEKKFVSYSQFKLKIRSGFFSRSKCLKNPKEKGRFSSLPSTRLSSPDVKEPCTGKNSKGIIVFEPLDLKKCENELVPLEFVLPGMLSGTVGALVAPGGVGKSMLSLEVAIAVSSGKDLANLWSFEKINTGKVLYLPAEDQKVVVMHRVKAMLAHMSLTTRKEMYDRLEVVPMVGKGCDLMSIEWQSSIEKAAENKKLIIFDTLNRYHSLEENNARQMSQLIKVLENIAENTRASILFLHHANKSSILNETGDTQQAIRGSSVLTDNVRWQGNLIKISNHDGSRLGIPQEVRHNYVRLVVSKMNYGPTIPDRWLKRVDGGVLVPVADRKSVV